MPNQSRPKVRKSRALGIALTPKASKHLEKRPYPPGEHGRNRRQRPSDYSVRLMEKQRLRAQYDISEKQMARAFAEARRSEGRTGEVLIANLEMRLDALVLRSGFARTIYQARQAVTHHHVLVDGKRVDRPSYKVRIGQVISIAEKSKTKTPFQIAASGEHTEGAPAYLNVSIEKLEATLVSIPEREAVPVICNEQLVVEFYAR